jgi:hypothetical protein
MIRQRIIHTSALIIVGMAFGILIMLAIDAIQGAW